MPVKHQPLFEIQIPECEGDILQIQELNFAYPDGHVALRGINPVSYTHLTLPTTPYV